MRILPYKPLHPRPGVAILLLLVASVFVLASVFVFVNEHGRCYCCNADTSANAAMQAASSWFRWCCRYCCNANTSTSAASNTSNCHASLFVLVQAMGAQCFCCYCGDGDGGGDANRDDDGGGDDDDGDDGGGDDDGDGGGGGGGGGDGGNSIVRTKV